MNVPLNMNALLFSLREVEKEIRQPATRFVTAIDQMRWHLDQADRIDALIAGLRELEATRPPSPEAGGRVVVEDGLSLAEERALVWCERHEDFTEEQFSRVWDICDALRVRSNLAAPSVPSAGVAGAVSAEVAQAITATLQREIDGSYESDHQGQIAFWTRIMREWISSQSPAATPQAREGVERDAERYRWLRDQQWNTATLFVIAGSKDQVRLGTDCPSGERLDAAIDAALADKGKGE